MKRMIIGLLLLFLLFALTSPSRAREWTDNTGKCKIEAELVEVKNGNVRLKRQDGKIITLPVVKLSKTDQDYLSNPNPLAIASGWVCQFRRETKRTSCFSANQFTIQSASTGLGVELSARSDKTLRGGNEPDVGAPLP